MNKQTNDTTKKGQRKPASKMTDEPGKKYWLVFGQIHFVKAATGNKPAKRRQVRLAEYLTTETLDHVGEITEAIRKQFEGTGTAERVEIWQVKEMSRQKWQSKRKEAPKAMVAVIHFQPDLFPAEEITSARPATLCPMPGANGAVAGKDAGNGAQAQGEATAKVVGGRVVVCDATGKPVELTKSAVPPVCANEDARCEREGTHKGRNGLLYCAQCWAAYPDEKPAREPVALLTRDDLPGATA